MSYMRCYKLIPVTGGIVCHGLQETPDSFLVEWCDASVLRNQFLFFRRKQLPERRRTAACQHEGRIYTTFFQCCHIPKVERTSSQFIVFLGSPTYPKKHSKLRLIQP